jgi:hypothetical protein
VRSNGPSRRLLSQDDPGVPGLGFDYSHFAATHPRGNHDRDRNSQSVGVFFPFFGGGYYTPLFPGDVEEAPAAEAQQLENVEPDAGQPPARSRYAESPQNYAASRAPVPEPQPQRESEEYVFVRRDGTMFFAVAYAWENGALHYVTNEGVRHSLAGEKLDLDATQQFNEQRGLNFRSPLPAA